MVVLFAFNASKCFDLVDIEEHDKTHRSLPLNHGHSAHTPRANNLYRVVAAYFGHWAVASD